MNKKTLIWIIAAIVAVIAIVGIVVSINNNNNQNGGSGGSNGGGGSTPGLNESSEITDTSVEGDRIEGTSVIVTDLVPGASSRSGKVTVVNAGDTLQNHMVTATFLDASGHEIATGSFSAAALDPGATKEATMLITSADWQDYASVRYEVSE